MVKRDEGKAPGRAWTPNWVEQHEWNGINPGDRVLVAGEPRAAWEFKHVHARPDGEVISVFVVGGERGERRIRVFTPDRVSLPKQKRTRRAKSDE